MRRDAQAEARVFLDSVGDLQAGDLPPALDVESPFDGLKRRGLRRWIRVWLERVERRLRRKPIVYTNRTSWAQTGDTLSFALRGHALWVANWDVSAPLVPADNWAEEAGRSGSTRARARCPGSPGARRTGCAAASRPGSVG